jgi:hypothetical protein
MGIANQGWYNRNEGRNYPLDDAATAVADLGGRLPGNVLADFNLRWPADFGRYAFVSALSVTPTLVTLTIQAAEAADSVAGFQPLAVVSVRRPVTAHRAYALRAQAAGVGGWVVFGSGVDDRVPYQARFSGPAQSRLAPRAARAYRPPPVTSVGVLNAEAPLSGVVLLRAQSPLTITKEQREIEGVNRDCVVFRLVDGAGADGFPLPPEARRISGFKEENVFRQFSGPCAGRPESETCGEPTPIEFVNAVGPDCDGVLTVEFAGCAVVAQITGRCGVVVDCGLSVADACLPTELPTSAGLLPSEIGAADVNAPAPVAPAPEEPGESESLVLVGGLLPHVDCFEDLAADDFSVESGLWTFVADDSPTVLCPGETYAASDSLSNSVSQGRLLGSYASNTAAARNVTVWRGGDAQATFRKVTADVKMVLGPTGARHNAGLVLNYRPHPTAAGLSVYHAVEVDYDLQQLKVVRFNGTALRTVTAASVPGVALGEWYRLEASAAPAATPGRTTITARIVSVTTPGAVDTQVSVTVNDYAPSTGVFGLHANRALSRFSFFKVEEVPGG